MPNNWKKYKLSEAFDIIGGGTPKTTVDEYWNGNIPWLSVVDFNNDQRTVLNTEKTITELGLQKSSTKLLKKGQLIISARGTVGQLAQLGRDMTFNQSCYGLSGKEKLLINDYGYYLLKQSVSNIQSNAHGSVFDTITRNTFENIEVHIPEIKEQRAIASILSALDDKIELNLQMNRTLEEMAMTLYKHWFIDFGPFQNGEFVDSELGKIPKGWEVKRLEEMLEIKYGKDHKKLESGNIPVYGSGGIMRYVNQFLYDQDSILIPRKGTLSNLFYITKPFWSVDTMFYTKIKQKHYGKYVFYFLKTIDLASMDVGSAVPSLTTELLKRINTLIPPIFEIEKYDEIVTRYFNIIESNTQENQTLTILRDTLLPKLISGEVRVKDVEQTISQAL
ncbi:MAG TPA: restriction endonuclease subunit S [Bacteroidales bacterium]|nr:restriction endonuclease subunit S [Bacteroidales bacterium]